jgi:ferritin|tara:strand:- start:1413 stop:2051 length:639 start_codon:yes stop_codon:yes gene_type:complete
MGTKRVRDGDVYDPATGEWSERWTTINIDNDTPDDEEVVTHSFPGNTIPRKTEKALNKQIQNEFYAAYLYLSMSIYCDKIGFKGIASWLSVQSAEEISHANKLIQYMQDRFSDINLKQIWEPPAHFGSLLDLFNKAFDHENKNTESFQVILGIALSEADFATAAFLQWYILEQVEEERIVGDVLERLKIWGVEDKDKSALLLLDQELGNRTK